MQSHAATTSLTRFPSSVKLEQTVDGHQRLRKLTNKCVALLVAIEETINEDQKKTLRTEAVVEYERILGSIHGIVDKLSEQSALDLLGGPVREVEAEDPANTFGARVDARCSEFLRVADAVDSDHGVTEGEQKHLLLTRGTKVSNAEKPEKQHILPPPAFPTLILRSSLVLVIAISIAMFITCLEGFQLSNLTSLQFPKTPFPLLRPETPQAVSDKTYGLSQSDSLKLELALQKNYQGVESLTFNDGPGALTAFSEAISDILDLLSRIPEDKTSPPSIKQNLAIMYANRAGAKLAGGTDAEVHSALRDAQLAEKHDPSLNLAYSNQARAYARLKKTTEAQDVLAAALLREDLEDDGALVDALIDTYTAHKGFSNDEKTFKSWLSKVVTEPRIRTIKGEWQRRIDAHLAQWQKESIGSHRKAHPSSAHSSASSPVASSSVQPLSDSDGRKVTQAIEKNLVGMHALLANARPKALHAFTDAIEILIDVWSRNPRATQIFESVAVSYSNRADAWLMDGLATDAPIALLDAVKAEIFDPSDSRAYQQQARAHYRLQHPSKALDVLARALRREDIRDNTVLVDTFVAIYTDQKGFPEDMKAFREWLSTILVEDEQSKLRLIGVGGEWRRRLSPYLAQLSGHTSPLKQFDWCKAVMATEKNIVGLKAFETKDRSAALKAFTEAIEGLIEVLSRNPDFADQKTNLAALYSNRADTWLLSGNAVDADAAARDAQLAQTLHPSLNYAYYHQARAYSLLQNTSEAMDILARALRRKDLEDDNVLVDELVQLYTDRKGFSNDEQEFKSWLSKVTVEDEESKWRLRGVKGEWQKRIDAQLSKWKK